MFKKLATVGLAILSLYGAAIATSSFAAAGPYWGYHRWHRGWGGVGLGVGLLAGAIAANSYYDGCYITRQPVTDGWGNFLGYRNVRVCG